MKLSMNQQLYEYDVRGLLMAFYPGAAITADEDDRTGTALSVLYGEGEPMPCRISLCRAGHCEDASVSLDLRDRSHAKPC